MSRNVMGNYIELKGYKMEKEENNSSKSFQKLKFNFIFVDI